MTESLAFVLPGRLEALTGGSRYDRRVVEGLRRLGVAVDVVELDGEFPFPDEATRRAASDRLAALPDGTLAVVDGLALGALPGEVEAHAARLMIVALVHHPLCDEAGLAPFDVRRLRGSERRALRAVRRVIVTSRTTAGRVFELFGADLEVRVVEPGLDRPEGARATGREGPLELTAVGALTPRKAQLVLLEALRGLDELDWRLWIVGRDDQDPEYARRVAEAARAHGPRVVLAGALPDAERDARLDATDVFVHPALYEGFGMAVQEALARGLPVVTTRGGALSETVPEGAGLHVAPGDVEELRNALGRVLGDADLRATLAEGARHAAAGARSWDDAVEEFRAALEAQAAAGRGGFDAGWLTLRRAADERARARVAPEVRARLAAAWAGRASGEPMRCVDLGTGSGNGALHAARELVDGPQRWTLVDNDDALLERAVPLVRALGHDVEGARWDLGADLDALPLEGADLVMASALLDLASARWIEALVRRGAEAGVPAWWLSLSVDGHVEWEPLEPEDSAIAARFHADMLRDKGLGAPALGPGAIEAAASALADAGYDVLRCPTPWELGAGDAALQERYARDVAAALGDAGAWLERRLAHVRRGASRLVVGHVDLVAVRRSE